MTFGAQYGHLLDGRLVLQEIAAIDRVVEVLPLAVAQLPRLIVAAVDAALGTDAVRAFDRRQAHQVDGNSQFGQFHGGCQARQTAADNHHALFGHLVHLTARVVGNR